MYSANSPSAFLICHRERSARSQSLFSVIPSEGRAQSAALPRDATQLEWHKQTPYNQPHDYVFASQRLRGEKPVDLKEVFVKSIKPVIEECGLVQAGTHYGWHSLRHSVGTALWELTRDRVTVRDMLRHSRESVTDRYMHGVKPRLVEAQDKLVIAMGLKAPAPAPIQRRLGWGRRMSHHRGHSAKTGR